jgi:hypothetical protein
MGHLINAVVDPQVGKQAREGRGPRLGVSLRGAYDGVHDLVGSLTASPCELALELIHGWYILGRHVGSEKGDYAFHWRRTITVDHGPNPSGPTSPQDHGPGRVSGAAARRRFPGCSTLAPVAVTPDVKIRRDRVDARSRTGITKTLPEGLPTVGERKDDC